MKDFTTNELISARKVMQTISKSIHQASTKLNSQFSVAVDALFCKKGKIVVTGIGKSGHLGKKLASTLCSTGSPASFLHPSEAVHGDLGLHQLGDPVIFLSNSGTTPELLFLEPIFHSRNSQIVGILGLLDSPLGEKVDLALDASVKHEADPFDVVPTASFSVAASLGDALSSALMKRRGFSEIDYAKTHPGGQLGRNLILNVSDIMRKPKEIALVQKQTPLNELVAEMTEKSLGAACVMNENELQGIITDGDLRRVLRKEIDLTKLRAEQIMTSSPKSVTPDMALGKALKIMETKHSQITVLPVVKKGSKELLGLIRIHDILTPEII